LDEADLQSLAHAVAVLRWLLDRTSRGWSHAAIDPLECKRAADRFTVLFKETHAQLKTVRTATVTMTDVDATYLQEFIALIQAVEPGGSFARLLRGLRQITALIGSAEWRPSQRVRRSSLAEP
jgi:hypothetical protein